MWLLGHLALGYFAAYIVGKYTRERLIVPLVFLVSMAPDFDFFLRGFIIHRGPTHSLFLAVALFVPLFLLLRSGYVYFAALLSHLMADYFVANYERMQLFLPLTTAGFAAPSYLRLSGVAETVVEVGLFIIMVAMLVRRVQLSRESRLKAAG
jgi:membrane-bound metal-dependent hydrolase YbcI (DUF457 family)